MLPFNHRVVMQIHGKDINMFKRKWNDYKGGFGNPLGGEYWLGLENVHQITKTGQYSLDVELTGKNPYTEYVQKTITLSYTTFEISNEADGYRLKIGGFHNNGHTFLNKGHPTAIPDFFNYHNGMMFTTSDKDNDRHNSFNCGTGDGGVGWWYNACQNCNLNRGNDRGMAKGPEYHHTFDQSKMILKGSPNKKI